MVWCRYGNHIFTFGCFEYWLRGSWVFFTFGIGFVYWFLGLAMQTQWDIITSIFLCHGGNYWYRQVAVTRKKLSNFL